MLFKILHLSDFHFGPMAYWHDEANPNSAGVLLAQEVMRALAKNEPRSTSPLDFDAVILSGDFVWSGKSASSALAYSPERAYETTIALAEEFARKGLVDKELTNLVVLPGNHDIAHVDRSGDAERTRIGAEEEYRRFLKRLFPKDPHRETWHLGYCHVFSSRETPIVRPVVLLSLNSCRIETVFTPGLGWVGYDQVESLIESELPERLRQWESLASNRTLEMPVCIACLHHHVHMPDPVAPSYLSAPDERKISFLTDAPEMLDTLMELGFGVILHGHAHSARRYAYGQHPRRAGAPPERQLNLAAIAGAGSVCLAKESEHISHDHQFQVVECYKNVVLIRSYEAPLRKRDGPRNWSAIEFEFPYTRDHDDKFAEAMQGRLSRDLATKATYEFDRFNACVDFEGLIRGDSRLRMTMLANLVKVLPGMPPGHADLAAGRALEIRSRYERRLEECRADLARAKEERKRLHQWLNDTPGGRLETYFALTWGWPPIHAPI